jgi:RND family efflux transporter MFP subunit
MVHPKPGGIQRLCVQPGTVEPYEAADIYAKVSGYLAEQSIDVNGRKVPVDIGTHVKAGDVIARIAKPEYEKQVERDQARVQDAAAKVKQMEASLQAAEAEARAARASVVLAKVMVKAKSAYRSYRQKQLERISALAKARAIDQKLAEEQEDFYLSALEEENAAKEHVNTNQEKVAAAEAKIKQTAADIDQAKAAVGVAEAQLAESRVLFNYTFIRSEYTGVITKRSFHVGDFIRAADQGGTTPMLRVERTDVMRIVVQVPDRDVPFVSTNSTATVEIDALPGLVFPQSGKLHVSRWADAEDPVTRTMRTEIDVPNPDGKLRHGMYGRRVAITLTEGSPGALSIPSAALTGKAEDGRGTVRVVRAGKVHLVPVNYASDNGVEVEVVSGLTPQDNVIVRASGPVEEGTPVTAGDDH